MCRITRIQIEKFFISYAQANLERYGLHEFEHYHAQKCHHFRDFRGKCSWIETETVLGTLLLPSLYVKLRFFKIQEKPTHVSKKNYCISCQMLGQTFSAFGDCGCFHCILLRLDSGFVLVILIIITSIDFVSNALVSR